MSWISPLEIFALLPFVFWGLLALDRSRTWPGELFLPTDAEGPSGSNGTSGADEESIVAVVPARNEADMLTLSLPSLLDQECPGLSVILVDDGSTDETLDVARRLAAKRSTGDRLRIVEATPTPVGWAGKVHALACGVEVATEGVMPEWLLFTDADIRHRQGSVRALLRKAREPEGPYDLVSVMARLRGESFWERLLIPAFVFFFHLLYPFRRVRSKGSRVAAAAGGCVLIRRETLAAAGGLAALEGAVIDDVALAKAIQGAGGRLWLGFDPGTVSVRPYRGLGPIWRMVSRSAFVQLRYNWLLLAAVVAGLLLFVASPPLLAAMAAWEVWAPEGASGSAQRALLWSLFAWALEARALRPYVRHHRVPVGWSLALPFASVLYASMTVSSALDHALGRGSRWKGRSYSK